MKSRSVLTLLLFICLNTAARAATIVTDRSEKAPIPGASVFDSSGKMIGMTDTDGYLPELSASDYPLTIRSLGYIDQPVASPADTIVLTERVYELPEIEVGAADRTVVRLICYVRQYTDMASENQSATTFSEYMVDYFLPRKGAKKVKTQKYPRVLGWRGFGRFTDSNGLDSVAYLDHSTTGMFDLIDFVAIDDAPVKAPEKLRGKPSTSATDTIRGRHGLKEVYRQNDNSFSATFDALADKKDHRWSPMAMKLIGATIDIDQMFMSKTFYRNISGEYMPEDLISATYTMNAICRGKWIKKAFDSHTPVGLKAYFEVYVADRMYLPADEAKTMMKTEQPRMKIKRPAEAPAPDASIRQLINRVAEKHNREKSDRQE